MTAYGIMQALFMRERTGEGQLVDSAMFDNMLALNEAMAAVYSVAGQIPERGKLRNVWPRGAFQASDGYIALNVPDNIIWGRLATAIGREDLIEDERSSTAPSRSENADYLQPIIEEWLGSKTREEAVNTLNEAGVPCGPVNTAEDVFNDPHVKARGSILSVKDPEVGTFGFMRTPPHMSSAPELPAEPAPNLGQHTREILQDILGYDVKDVDRLASDGVVQVADGQD